ncbi:hypothetical protein ElyMa_003447700 [Elysia marginata]|uniref:Uncharacterized protein n=1 Tax=Elysia marginata TaxID=1093978 RepID=A0AAV4JSJ3_9GAST|nr:hypothetical protein ElyMa_003447700 [Elysia marginata]
MTGKMELRGPCKLSMTVQIRPKKVFCSISSSCFTKLYGEELKKKVGRTFQVKNKTKYCLHNKCGGKVVAAAATVVVVIVVVVVVNEQQQEQ